MDHNEKYLPLLNSQEKLEYAKNLVKEAGQLIQTMMVSKLDIERKTSIADLVTNADIACEQFLVNGINQRFMNQSFLTEENTVGTQIGDEMWVIDPIDGTLNFVHQKKNFSISVAYFENQKPVFGIIYDVINDTMYWGHVEMGAYCNEEKLPQLDESVTLKESMITGDVFHPNLFDLSKVDIRSKILTYRYTGSGALESAYVVNGQFQAYVFPKITIWDVAAGMVLLKCLGGTWVFGDTHDDFIFDDTPRIFIGASNDNIKNELIGYL